MVPGFVDVHCHGGFGADFSTSPEAPVRRAIQLLHEQGATTLLASLVTARSDDMNRAAELVDVLLPGV